MLFITLTPGVNLKNKSFYIIAGIIGLFSILTIRENYVENGSVPSYTSLVPFTDEAEGLEVSYKALDAEESKLYLNRDLIDRGYQPVHITIQNNSPNTYEIAPDGVSLPLALPKDVAMKVTKRAIPRAIGYKIASFFFWPLMIPSTIDSINTYKTHKSLKRAFAAKAIKEEIILPYSTVHRILFVKAEDYNEQFSIALVNKSSGDKEVFCRNAGMRTILFAPNGAPHYSPLADFCVSSFAEAACLIDRLIDDAAQPKAG